MKNKFKFLIFLLVLTISKNIYAQDNKIILDSIYDNYHIPEVSGSVSNFPWRNDDDFLKAKDKYKTPILMAGFCAVLKNPLPGEEYNVRLASEKIIGNIIKSNNIFSQNSSIGPYTKSKGFKDGASYISGNIQMTEGGGVCKIATTLYNLAVLSDLEIVERYNHSMPINYVPYGQDATVAYGIKDFRFKNNKEGNILIWSKMIDNRLYMAFYGESNSPKVDWNHQILDITSPPVKYIKNTNLNPGEMITRLNGMDGASVKSTVTVTQKDGSFSIKNMGTSYYQPLPKIIEINWLNIYSIHGYLY